MGDYWGPFERWAGRSSRSADAEEYRAAFYDAATFRQDVDAGGYLELARAHPGPVLEVACGTGRILLRLARYGHEVFGIDHSEAMLRRLRSRLSRLPEDLKRHVSVQLGDATSFQLARHFSLVILPAFTISLLRGPTAKARFLECARDHLLPGGVLAFDYLVFPQKAGGTDGQISHFEFDLDSGERARCLHGHQRDGGDLLWNLCLELEAQGETERVLWSERREVIDELEIDRLLADAGFAVIGCDRFSVPMASEVGTRVLIRAVARGSRAHSLCFPYSRLDAEADELVVLSEGSGSSVLDTEGREYIDASGGLWSAQCGQGHPAIVEAVASQLRKLSCGPLFERQAHEPALALGRTLLEIAPKRLTRVYLTTSGSESVELAIKLARLFFDLRGQSQKKEILYFDQSYHGTFYGSLGVSGCFPDKDRIGPLVPALSAVPTPDLRRKGEGVSYDQFVRECIEAFERRISAFENRVAAFIYEPVLGSAGTIVPPPDYFEAVQRICRQRGILTIVDEVATGFGRTGRMFASDHFGLLPDIMLLSKGISSGYLPLGAVLFSEEIAQALLRGGAIMPHGSSSNGNPACCAAGLAAIDVIRRERLAERAERTGARLGATLQGLGSIAGAGETRGIGLMWSLDLRHPATGRPVGPAHVARAVNEARHRGVLPYPGPSCLTFMPALTLTDREVDQIGDRVGAAIRAVSDWAARAA